MCSRGVYLPTNQPEEAKLLNGPSFLRVNSFVDDDASKVVGKYNLFLTSLFCYKVIDKRIYPSD